MGPAVRTPVLAKAYPPFGRLAQALTLAFRGKGCPGSPPPAWPACRFEGFRVNLNRLFTFIQVRPALFAIFNFLTVQF